MEQDRLERRRQRELQKTAQPAFTRDGHRLEIGVSISSADEVAPALAAGGGGIGLFRTEMLYWDRKSAPDEANQFDTYKRVLVATGNLLPVIIRTFDVGGDKPLDYLNLPPEENPFLGYRAIRIYPRFETMFRTQIRALVRASVHGKLKLLVPMIATVEEARWAKKIIREEQEKCLAVNVPFDATMPIGAMIEVPSAALMLGTLSRELDFFSIGSNDLLQYLMAADRSNPDLSGLYNPIQPAFLRMLKQIVDCSKENNKRIGLCGEMGGQTKLLPLLVGLGLDEISVAAPLAARLKTELAGLNSHDCRELLGKALSCTTANDVSVLLDDFNSQGSAPLIVPEMVIVDSDATTKEEAIKQAADQLYVLGRTEDSRAIEEAVWRREQTYSTGFGQGFAIPHCKTNAIRFNSLVLLKLKSPVKWNSLDGQSVRVMILFAVRDTNSATEHMKVFAKLARQIIDEDFRLSLINENNVPALCGILASLVS
jgi:fructose-specific PTS system IIA-like component